MTSQLVADALMMAVWRRGRPRSSCITPTTAAQYTSERFQKLLTKQGITCSMSRASEVCDNSSTESFFSSLKTEHTARNVSRSLERARSDEFDYIERFYNPTRRHSTLGYVKPDGVRESSKSLGRLPLNRQQPSRLQCPQRAALICVV